MRRKIACLLGTAMVTGTMSVSMPVASAQTGLPAGALRPGQLRRRQGHPRHREHVHHPDGHPVPLEPRRHGEHHRQRAGRRLQDGRRRQRDHCQHHVTSATQVAINDPVLVKGGCGENNAVGISPSAAAGGQLESYTALFGVNCQGAATTATAVPPRGGGLHRCQRREVGRGRPRPDSRWMATGRSRPPAPGHPQAQAT